MTVSGAPAVERDRPIRRRSRFQDFPWWLVIIIAAIIVLIIRIVTETSYRNAFASIRTGLATTIYTTFVAFAIAVVIGLLAGLGRVARNVVIRNIAITYIELVRGVPILVLIFTIAFVVVPLATSQLEVIGLANNAVSMNTRAIIALALIYGAFLAEIFRAGIESIPRGQMEAARSLGMSNTQTMRYVILPQAIRNVLPAIGNDFVAMLKDSSLVSALGVRDLTQLGRLFASSTFQFQESYFTLTLFYLVMTLVLSLVLQWFQRRLRSTV